MEPVLGGGPGETGSSGQGGHVMEQAKLANETRMNFAVSEKKEEVHERSRSL